jgi:membrane-associated phospholipid phosphatase
MINSTNPVSTPLASTPLGSPLIWGIPVLSFIGFLVVWLTGLNQEFFLAINGGLSDLGQGSISAIVWANITILGDTLVAIALLSPFVRRRPDIIWAVLITAIFATLWVHGLKPLTDNPRPGAIFSNDVIHIIGVTLHGGSFPSGHTTTAFALAGVICIMRAHPAVMITAVVLAILAGISRSVVGAHWPLDIFAGAFGGWTAAIIGVVLFKRLAQNKNWGELTPGQIPGQKAFNIGLLVISFILFIYGNGYPASQPFQYTVGLTGVIIAALNLWHLYNQSKTPVS